MGKPCAIGSVGFPCIETRRRRPRSFLLHESSQRETESPLRAHYNPRAASHEQSRRFPLQHRTNLSWFCESNFINKSLIPRETLKAGYTAHNFRHMQVPNPVGKYTNSFCLITSWVSTIIGN